MKRFILYTVLFFLFGPASAQEYRNFYQRGHVKNGVLQLQEPNGVAINNTTSRVYIADTYRHRIVVLDLSGTLITTFGTYGTSNGQFNFPRAVAVAADGSVYVAESNGNRVQKFASDGTYQLQFGSSGSGPGQFNLPQGIAVSPVVPNDVYVVDANNRRVQYFSSSGTFKGTWGTSGASNGQFNNPVHAAINSAGEVYVVDGSNHRVQKFSSTGTYISSIGSLGSTDGLLQFPTGVAIDASNNIYVADRTNSRVQKFNSAHVFQSKFGTQGNGTGFFNNLSGIAVDNSNNIYTTESSDIDRLQKFTNAGASLLSVGAGTANGLFSNPADCVFDSNGNLFVVDSDNNRIQKFGPTGAYLTQFGTFGSGDGQFIDPIGIGVDNAIPNNVYVVDGGNSRIQKFSNTGGFMLKFGSFGSANGQFSSPRDVAVDGSGNIYVTESSNNRIQKFNSAGALVGTPWGGTASSSTDGLFNNPWGIALDASGNVLVCDANNSRIQKLTNTGTFISKWTTGSSGIRGIALDNSDNVYVSDINNDVFKKYNSAGTQLLTLGSMGFNNSEFYDPSGVALFGTKIVVVDLYDRAQFFHPLATEPSAQTTSMTFANKTISSFDATFTAATGNPDKYLVLRRTGASPTGLPTDGSSYALGASLGNGKIVYNGAAGTFRQGGLASGTAYHFDVFSYNGADTLSNYRLAFQLETNTTTNPSPFSLVKDINETLFEASGNPQAYDAGTNLLVVATDFTNGTEIWKSDGTPGGTTLLKDIVSGSTNVSLPPTIMGRLGTTVVFTANDNVNGRELWKTDGTDAGTVMIRDINPGPASSNLTFFNATNPTTNPVTMNGAIYFAANDGTNGVELWKTDGTTAGTVMVKDIAAGSESAFSTFMSTVVFNNAIYFFAYTPAAGWEFWKSDGTSGGTQIVKDMNPGTKNGVSFGGTPIVTTPTAMYFVADNGGTEGAELWKSDGTPGGTAMLKDVRTTGYSSISGLTTIGSTLYFSADNGIDGAELWKSDGTEATTAMLKDIYTGTGTNGLPNASTPSSLTNLNGTLLFVAITAATGPELYKSDGTAPGTVLVKDIGAGGAQGVVINSAVGVYNNALYFGGIGPNGNELWKSDGTLAGTVQVADIYPGISSAGAQNSSVPAAFVVSGGTLYFTASDATGRELWKTNGTTATQVKNFNAELATNSSSVFTPPVALTNEVIFVANDGVNGGELWKSDGTETGTVMLKDINAGPSTGTSSIVKKVNGQIFFIGNDGTTGSELWKTDGTPTGTVLVKDIFSGIGAGVGFSQVTRSAVLGNLLYFMAFDASGGNELWKSDGSATGTTRVMDINPGTGSSSPDLLAAVTANSVVLFFANDGTNGVQLWKTDGTFTIPLTNVSGGLTVTSSVTRFCTLGSAYFFSATEANGTSASIWRSNGVDQAGTIRLNTSAANSYTYDGLFALNDKVVFQKIDNSPAGYDEYWVTDGTVSGTTKLKDFSQIATGVACLFQSVVYFRASSTKGEGAEMWRTDGTVAGTNLFKEFSPGAGAGAGSTYTAFTSRFYFNATDVSGGFWTSDGTTCGTFKMVDDPTLNNLGAQFFVEAGQRVFIFATTPDNSSELFSIDLTQITAPLPTAIGTQPVKLLKKIGDPFTLSVTATGTNLTYQWLKDNTVIAGATSATYTKTNAQVAETGLYKAVVTGTCGPVSSNEVKVDVVDPVKNYTLAFNTFGSNQTDYRMISVPLVLTDKAVASVFADDLGAYDKTKWRLFHYSGTSNQELSSSSNIDIGLGYWLIAKNQATIDTGTGQISMDDPFLIPVAQGWNQIGNPFPVDVPWSDIQAANSGAGTITLRTYEGSFTNGTTLKAYSGGYFMAPANGQLKIPRGTFTGRMAAPPEIKPIDAESWEVLLTVKISDMSYGLGGVGMDPAAKEIEFDYLDEYNLPRFMEYVELKHPFTFTGYAASKSIVRTKKENVWEFAVESNLASETASIQWDKEHLGANDRELYLVDLVNGEVIDMRRLNQYDFKMTSGSHPFRVAFGDKDFVEKSSLTEIERLNVSPSPFASEITVKYSIPRTETVAIDLMDSQGRKVNTLLQPSPLAPGQYESRMVSMDALPAGLYVVRMQAGESNVLTKIIKQ